VATLALSACGNGPAAVNDLPETTATTSRSDATDPGEALCPALLTWHSAQQRFLDDLSDVPLAELDQPSPRVLQAGLNLGSTLLEVTREALALGCDQELVEGAPERCAQIARLEAEGPAAESVLDLLVGECG
jgi:hypothetical protein